MHDGAYAHDLQMLNARVTPGCYIMGPCFFTTTQSSTISCICHPVYLALFFNHYMGVFVKKLREQMVS
jgi:hypothetical protein